MKEEGGGGHYDPKSNMATWGRIAGYKNNKAR